MASIDLNADMGEYADDVQRDIETALMRIITSCSIACGGHAGDEASMRRTVRLANRHSVSVGAHPSYPDRTGFGRRSQAINPTKLSASLRAQIAALKSILREEGLSLRHVKPHGALYNDAAKDTSLARLVVDAAGDAVIVGAPGSALEVAAKETGKPFAAEGFVDRLYMKSGCLTPRGMLGAVIEDVDMRAKQACAIAQGASFAASDGELTISVNTLCIHADTPHALETAHAVRDGLRACGVAVRAF